MQKNNEEIQHIDGVIERITDRSKGYSLMVGGSWLSAWGKCTYKVGDKVSLDYVVNSKGYKDIVKRDKIALLPKSSIHEAETVSQAQSNWRRVPVEEVVNRRAEALIHAIRKLPSIKEEFAKNNVPISNISTIETILGILTVRADSVNEKSENR